MVFFTTFLDRRPKGHIRRFAAHTLLRIHFQNFKNFEVLKANLNLH